MKYTVEINGKQYPLSFGNGTILFWTHKIERATEDIIENGHWKFSAYELTWLIYSALKFGCEEKKMRWDYDYVTFVNQVLNPDITNQALEAFKDHNKVLAEANKFDIAAMNAVEKKAIAEQADTTSGGVSESVVEK